MSEEICTCGHALAMHQPYGVHQPSDRCLVFVCSCKGYTERPLPPTAEQTSIARFNALANEIRANQAESLKFYGSFMNVFDVLIHKIDRLAKPNVAVAKKKAAPLVGKKGTGRKG